MILQALRGESSRNNALNKIDPKQAAVFIAVLAVIAFAINSTQEYGRREDSDQAVRQQFRQTPVPIPQPVAQRSTPEPAISSEQQRKMDAAAAAQKAAMDAAAEHKKYLARYLAGRVSRKPGVQTIAIVAVSENGAFDPVAGDAIAARFKSDSVEMVFGLFTPQFVSDGLFGQTFGGSKVILGKLELLGSLDGLLLAREDVRYTTNPSSLANVLTANMHLEVTMMPVAAKGERRTWTYTANGPGFKQTDARAAAEERLLKQIANDASMSLSAISPDTK